MIDFLFGYNSGWSWGTFFLYYAVSVIVVFLCQKGVSYSVGCTNTYNRSLGLSKNRRKLISFILFFAAYVILVLLATVRSNMVGPDTWKYVDDFMFANEAGTTELFSGDWSVNQVEPFFFFFTSFIRSKTDDYHIFFLCLFALIAGGYIWFIKHFLQRGIHTSILKLFILTYVGGMSGMRSALGMFPLLISFITLDKKHYTVSFLCTIVAALCHYTMIYNLFIVLGVWLVRNLKSIQQTSSVILFALLSIILSSFSLSFFFDIFADTKYILYVEDIYEKSFLGSMIYVLLLIFVILKFKQFNQNKSYQTLLYVSILFLLSYPFIYVSGAYRIASYYALPRLMVWGMLINVVALQMKNNRIVFNFGLEVLLFFYILFRFYQVATNGYFAYVI